MVHDSVNVHVHRYLADTSITLTRTHTQSRAQHLAAVAFTVHMLSCGIIPSPSSKVAPSKGGRHQNERSAHGTSQVCDDQGSGHTEGGADVPQPSLQRICLLAAVHDMQVVQGAKTFVVQDFQADPGTTGAHREHPNVRRKRNADIARSSQKGTGRHAQLHSPSPCHKHLPDETMTMTVTHSGKVNQRQSTAWPYRRE